MTVLEYLQKNQTLLEELERKYGSYEAWMAGKDPVVAIPELFRELHIKTEDLKVQPDGSITYKRISWGRVTDCRVPVDAPYTAEELMQALATGNVDKIKRR